MYMNTVDRQCYTSRVVQSGDDDGGIRDGIKFKVGKWSGKMRCIYRLCILWTWSLKRPFFYGISISCLSALLHSDYLRLSKQYSPYTLPLSRSP
jgi:hypothetical protein